MSIDGKVLENQISTQELVVERQGNGSWTCFRKSDVYPWENAPTDGLALYAWVLNHGALIGVEVRLRLQQPKSPNQNHPIECLSLMKERLRMGGKKK